MGELILISGANDSGKSRFAESLFRAFPGGRYYIATMRPQTEENRRRIEKHRRQREGLGFDTIETPGPVAGAAVSPEGGVLLEDVSNLLSNAVFERGETAEDVYSDILRLRDRCALLVAVTISGLRAADYDGETAAYIAALNELNAALLDAADAAVEMRLSLPFWSKGGADEALERLFGGGIDLQRRPDAAL